MDLPKMIATLRAEAEAMDHVIAALERLALGQGKRRGRPPAWVKQAEAASSAPEQPRRRGRPPGSKNKPKAQGSE